jgi:hypothetical protein
MEAEHGVDPELAARTMSIITPDRNVSVQRAIYGTKVQAESSREAEQ